MNAAPSIGIITALSYECVAVEYVIDNAQPWLPTRSTRTLPSRRYVVGTIPAFGGGEHQVALCQVRAGNNRAAIRAALLKNEFSSIEHIIMVGIAGGAPDPTNADKHVRLGDIVVSNEYGVVQFDNIKDDAIALEFRNPPRPPSALILDADAAIEREEERGRRLWEPFLRRVMSHGDKWQRPPQAKDVLRAPGTFDRFGLRLPALLDRFGRHAIPHPPDPKRVSDQPRVFRGVIGSSNSLLKNPMRRDLLRSRFGVRAIEMEGSGVADAAWELDLGYFVIRGICDYCDRSKNDDWHHYASAVSASYCRALIEQIPVAGLTATISANGLERATVPEDGSKFARHEIVAANLLRAATPRSVASLFRDVNEKKLAAVAQVSALPRMVTQSNALPREVGTLVIEKQGAVAIAAPSGYGKSHAVWSACERALKEHQAVPIFIPIGGMSSTDEVVKYLANAGAPSLSELQQNDDVVFVLDGWSEFPRDVSSKSAEVERSSMLALIGSRPIVATCRTANDSRFQAATLVPLERARVLDIAKLVDASVSPPAERGPSASFSPAPVHLLERGASALSRTTACGTAAAYQRRHQHAERSLVRRIQFGSQAARLLKSLLRGRSRRGS